MGYLHDTAVALADTIRHHLPDTVTVHPYETVGQGFDPPAVLVGLPSATPPDYETGQSQLGTFDWEVTWPVTLAVRLQDPATDQAFALDLTEQVVEALHRYSNLLGQSEDASTVAWRSGYNQTDANVRLIVVEFEVTTFTVRAT